MSTEPKKSGTSPTAFWGQLFSWKPSPKELSEQVAGYDSLSAGKSFRKVSGFLWVFSVLLTAAVGPSLLRMSWSQVVYGAVTYSILAVFCFRGHRWAFVASMILWTLEKGYVIVQAFTVPALASAGMGMVFQSIFFWALYVGMFSKALAVERARRDPIARAAMMG